jgi:predicted permease
MIHKVAELARRLIALFRRRQFDANLEQEMRLHQELREHEQVERGVSPEEAHYAVQRRFGNKLALREESRDMWGWNWLETLLQDLRYGLRQLRRNSGFTAVAVITLALGIAANTTIFSTVSEILLRKPPVHDPDRVVTVSSKNVIRGYDLQQTSAFDFEAWCRQNHVFEDLSAGDMEIPFTLAGSEEARLLIGDHVTTNYFHVLGIQPAAGRTFSPDEGQPGHDHVVILSNRLWREQYGGDPHLIGKDLQLDGTPYAVIGIMPAGTDMAYFSPRLWTPLVFTPKDLAPSSRENRYLTVFARLKPGVTVRQAQAEMASLASRLAMIHPKTDRGWSVTVLTLQESLIRSANVRHALMLLIITTAFVLLIACANVAGLLLARGAARGHEMTIRSAVGASRLRLVRQMLAESLLVGAAGGAIGLLMSVWGIRLLRASLGFNFYGREMAAGLYLDQPTLIFTLAISFFTVILFGFVPALRASKIDLGGGLKEGGRTGLEGRRRSRLRNVLVTGEIALALVLLTSAGITMRDFIREITESNGFNPNHIITADIQLNSRNYSKPSEQMNFFERVSQKLRELPGVRAASATSAPPLAGGSGHVSFSIYGQPPLPRAKRPLTEHAVVGPGYFGAMQIPLLKGRAFTQSDRDHAPLAAVASKEFARRFFPKGNAIGQRIKLDIDHSSWAKIVGVVGDVDDFEGQLSPDAQIYESYLQMPAAEMWVVVRSPLAPPEAASLLRRAVWSVDKDQPVGGVSGGVMTMEEVGNENSGGDKLLVALLGIFAALALALAAVGIYGVIAYSVSQRTHEIGIRMALGAQKSDVLRLVLYQGGLLTLIGCGIGLVLALPLPKVFGAVFSGFAPQGPVAAIWVFIIVAATSLLATYIPAYRATKVDPMVALRYE